MMHGCGLAARCILRDHPSRSLARGHHHTSHSRTLPTSHSAAPHRATSLVRSLVIAEHFPPSLETNFPPHGTVVSRSAASTRSQLAQVPSHEYGDVARVSVSAPAAAARRPGRRRSAGSPRTHSCRCGTTTGLRQHSATLTLMFLEIHIVRVSSD